MSKKFSKVTFSDEHSTLQDIQNYYVDSDESLGLYFDEQNQKNRFFGYTRDELQEELNNRKDALDRMCSLEVLASIEAHIRIDYLNRCQAKHKDVLSKQMRVVYSAKGNKASLVDDILFLWKKNKPKHKSCLDDLQKALDYRNWLAHGRYWNSRKAPHISKYDYFSLYTLAENVLADLELVQD
ncbi:hypothetical protein [Vibrio coralliilyticus]|uniref:hypothetical protein n=1 Tax=Vibrio coralliilyticus TaxID=190893 RepID=UPI00155FAEC1|nr:hypothetical protein [Vibrio coralliilyticus]NRF32983.1 hypothetical protein [Vibrio coralliilyticus]NRF55511.1 hypothetical protein [Vibrio coralliilyticus]